MCARRESNPHASQQGFGKPPRLPFRHGRIGLEGQPHGPHESREKVVQTSLSALDLHATRRSAGSSVDRLGRLHALGNRPRFDCFPDRSDTARPSLTIEGRDPCAVYSRCCSALGRVSHRRLIPPTFGAADRLLAAVLLLSQSRRRSARGPWAGRVARGLAAPTPCAAADARESAAARSPRARPPARSRRSTTPAW
jgi:hypothetical protein